MSLRGRCVGQASEVLSAEETVCSRNITLSSGQVINYASPGVGQSGIVKYFIREGTNQKEIEPLVTSSPIEVSVPIESEMDSEDLRLITETAKGKLELMLTHEGVLKNCVESSCAYVIWGLPYMDDIDKKDDDFNTVGKEKVMKFTMQLFGRRVAPAEKISYN